MPPTADNRRGQGPANYPAPKAIPLDYNSMESVINNDDLLTEILLRLPTKALIRFKSVCKEWRSIISSGRFCHQHTLRRPKLQPSLIIVIKTHPQNEKKLFYSNQTINGGKLTMTRTPYHMGSIFKRHRIIQACNGLMLLESFMYKNKKKELPLCGLPKKSYYVYNPATRKSREIILPENPEYPHVATVNLAFDPSKSPYYKIVCVRFLQRWFNCHIEVFESESHSWKVGLGAFNNPNLAYSYGGVYWNNSIYWELINDSAYYQFDIDKNEMKTISFPRIYNDPNIIFCESYLQESNGRLYHLQKIRHYHYRESETHFLNVYFDLQSELPAGWESESVALWELGRDDDDDDHHHSPWFFMYRRHSLDMNGAGTNPLILTVRSGSDEDEDEGETCSLLVHQDGKVRAYNFLDKTYQDLFYSQTHPSVFQFGETLALV